VYFGIDTRKEFTEHSLSRHGLFLC